MIRIPYAATPRLGGLVVRCADHPNYSGARNPTNEDCPGCIWVFNNRAEWVRARDPQVNPENSHLRLHVGGDA